MALAKRELGQIISQEQAEKILENSGLNVIGLSEQEKYELALILHHDMQKSIEGFEFRPQRFKINRENQTFTDGFGNSVEEIRGVILLKQRVRAYWEIDGDKVPACSSFDCVKGTTRNGETRYCAGCTYDAWGSADPLNPEKKGKACKEMRRIYILPENAQLPVIVSLPPTSIRSWDDFCSARVNMGISDISTEVVLGLVPQVVGKYTVSVIKPKNGRKLTHQEILRVAKIQKQFISKMQEFEQEFEIEADDYFDDNNISKNGIREPGEDEDFNFDNLESFDDFSKAQTELFKQQQLK